MVLKNFHTNALRDLCTEEQLDLLNSIDTLRSQGISHYISLPQIIVCGDQSSEQKFRSRGDIRRWVSSEKQPLYSISYRACSAKASPHRGSCVYRASPHTVMLSNARSAIFASS